MLERQQRKDIISYRIEKSHKSFDEAKAIAKLGYWNLTGNRLYYCIFHMASALLLDKGLSAKTHAGVIHLIGEKFIATGLLERAYGRLFRICMNCVNQEIMMTCMMQRRKKFCLILIKSANLLKT